MDPVVSKVGSELVKATLKKMLGSVPTPQRAIDHLAAQLWDEVVLEAVQAVQRLEARVGKGFELLRQQIDELDAALLALRLLDQATRSAGADRRRLMAQAVAGVYDPDLHVEMKSRAARALEQLEPSDVAALRLLVTRDTTTDVALPSATVGALFAVGCIAPVARAGWDADKPILHMPSKPVSPQELTPTAAAIVTMVAQWESGV